MHALPSSMVSKEVHTSYVVSIFQYNLNTSIWELTENTEPDTLWLSEGNFKTAGPMMANETLAERGGPGA